MGGKVAEGKYREQGGLSARAVANDDQFSVNAELVGQVRNGLADSRCNRMKRVDGNGDKAACEDGQARGVADVPSHNILLCLILCHGRLWRDAQPPG